ncbi:MAG: alginate export family protein [Methylococcales bacterium]|nr:alginate export family protein [Methylococcales bacterium]
MRNKLSGNSVNHPAFRLTVACGIFLGNGPAPANADAAQTYSTPPMTAYTSQMDDPLLGNKYAKPVWNLHDTLGLPEWLSVGVEQRTRYEDMNGTIKANTRGGDQQIALQTDLWLQARLGKFRVATEFMDSRAEGADIGPGKNVGSGVNNGMADPADFIQAYFSWADKDAFASALGSEIRVGRQTIDLGSRRLVSRPNFRNTSNSFTGVRFRLLDNAKWQFNAFATLPVTRFPTSATAIIKGVQQFDQEATRTWFSGGMLEGYKLAMGINSELYLYNLDEADSFDNPTRKRRYFTPGLRVYIKPQIGRFDFQAEGMGQFGTVRYNTTSAHDQQHEAWSEHVEAGYSFDTTWSPRLMLEYDYASGSQNPGAKSTTDSRFDPLYGNSVPDFGPSGIYGAFQRSNINSPGYKLNVAPASDVRLTLQQRLIWLASASDCWGGASCTSSSNLVLQPTHNSGSYVGNQLGLTGRYDFNSSLNFEVGWFHLFKGQFAKQAAATVNGAGTVPGEDVDYFYAQSQLRF